MASAFLFLSAHQKTMKTKLAKKSVYMVVSFDYAEVNGIL